ncbi:MAG TPA: class III extradiol ring-cleavage dioxygenase [Thermoanaerobaculia bacterium]|nr:class III extradiol ring-cleavage dioxygenase [Thermoanaerobaculia bacterium]
METRAAAPVLFVAHASPMLALERDGHAARLRAFGDRFPRPAAIVVVSAHWEAPRPIRVTTAPRPALIYDFGGFPRTLYELQYPAPGSPELAREIVEMLSQEGVPAGEEPRRGWDHGVWIPLRLFYPEASVPVVEVSLPVPRDPDLVAGIGRALAPLRDRGILLVGSGGIVHNLRLARLDRKDGPVDEWARKFDDWVRERVQRRDLEELSVYRRLAPHADLAVPESEHFDPLFFALGAAGPNDELQEVNRGFEYGNLSLSSFAFVPRGNPHPRLSQRERGEESSP